MGCDIHLHFEKKNKKGKWKKIDFPECLCPDDRNYALFYFLANIRKSDFFKFKPQFSDRGIPDDTCMPLNETDDFWIGDFGFTHAFLDEILAAPWKEAELEQCYFYIFCEYVIPRLCSSCGILSKEEERNIRVIMGFDN